MRWYAMTERLDPWTFGAAFQADELISNFDQNFGIQGACLVGLAAGAAGPLGPQTAPVYLAGLFALLYVSGALFGRAAVVAHGSRSLRVMETGEDRT
jgi:hypothetical protein